jgi:TnpA family transposase
MKRLSAKNMENPVYQVLIDLGKVSCALFLCDYLSL